MKYADLHVHTTFSDGSFTPEQVLEQARQKDLSCIAITDHDSVLAIEPALAAAASFNIEIVPGIELSTEIDDYEVHILGYCINWQAAWFGKKLRHLCQIRKERALAILEKLKAHGVTLDAKELLQNADPGSVGRLHIARMMKEAGFVFSVQEAFNKYIGNDRPCYVKKFRLTPKEAMRMIDQLQGVAVLAHPYCIGNDELIPEFVEYGLKGIEVYYPDHGKETITHYLNLAQEYGLLVTGGSDCHGMGKNGVCMGEVKIPYELVEKLKKEAGGLAQ